MKRYYCETCGPLYKGTDDRANFHRHKHGLRHRRIAAGLPPFKTVYPCEVCNHVFHRSDHLKQHLLTEKHRRNALHAILVRDGQRCVRVVARDGDWV